MPLIAAPEPNSFPEINCLWTPNDIAAHFIIGGLPTTD